jgi:hypothetical protein
MGIKSGILKHTANRPRKGLQPPRNTLSLKGGSLKSPFRFKTKIS